MEMTGRRLCTCRTQRRGLWSYGRWRRTAAFGWSCRRRSRTTALAGGTCFTSPWRRVRPRAVALCTWRTWPATVCTESTRATFVGGARRVPSSTWAQSPKRWSSWARMVGLPCTSGIGAKATCTLGIRTGPAMVRRSARIGLHWPGKPTTVDGWPHTWYPTTKAASSGYSRVTSRTTFPVQWDV